MNSKCFIFTFSNNIIFYQYCVLNKLYSIFNIYNFIFTTFETKYYSCILSFYLYLKVFLVLNLYYNIYL